MRKSLALAVATVSALGVGALVPSAANAASGTTTLSATVGISGPGLVSIVTTPVGTLTGSGPMTGSLGLTTVTDTRIPVAPATNSWKVQVSSTDFTLVGATGTVPTIPATNATVT